MLGRRREEEGEAHRHGMVAENRKEGKGMVCDVCRIMEAL